MNRDEKTPFRAWRLETASYCAQNIVVPRRIIPYFASIENETDMELTVLKSEIYREVEKRSSLEAAGLPDNFEQVWASECEGGFLDTYWREGCASAIQLFKRYLRNRTVDYRLDAYDADERLVLAVRMPGRYNDLLDGSISTGLKQMMAAHVLAGWLGVKAPSLSEKYAQEATEHAADLRAKLAYREGPKAMMHAKDDDHSPVLQDSDGYPCPKPDDDATLEAATDGDEGWVRKSTDRLILRQYEKCDHYPEPRGNHGRCPQCGPCHRP